MTTTVRVQARAWGARVEVNGETTEVGPNTERSFHIAEGDSQTFTVTHGEEPAHNPEPLEGEEVPGRRQNDELLGNNQSGATETAQTTDTADEQPVATSGRGRRDRGLGQG